MPHEEQVTGSRRKTLGGEAGMTLIEVMIATGVILVAFLLTMGSFVSISSTSAMSEDQAKAAAEASSVMEELRNLTPEELAIYQPPTQEDLPVGTGVSVSCFDADGGAHTLPLSPGTTIASLPNPLEVQVTVFWQDSRGRSFSTRTSAMLGR